MRQLVRKPHLIVGILILAGLGSLALVPHMRPALSHQNERKVTGSGVDSMLFEYDFDATNPAPGVFTPVPGGNLERAAGTKIKSIEVFDANDNPVFTETCPAPKTCTVVMGTTGNRDITVADDPQGVTIGFDRTRFRPARKRKWRMSCQTQLQRVTIRTSAAQAPTFRENCANGKCSVDVTYTF